MHKSLKIIGLAGAASALAMTPALASAQDQAMPGTTPPSMPDTGTTTTTPPPTAPSDTTTETDTGMPDSTAMDGPTPQTEAPPAPSAANTLTLEEQKAAIAKWPAETQAYYQSLTGERQKMFWALTDSDKVRLSQLPEDQREVAWGQIEAQVQSSQG